jgi:pimeloyl-ACP methyl ester carboxylesterase
MGRAAGLRVSRTVLPVMRTPRTAVVVLALVSLLVAGCDPEEILDPEPPEPTGEPGRWDAALTWEPCPDLPPEVLSHSLPGGVLPGFVTELVADVGGALLVATRSYDCATLPVPQDWDEPDSGETFDISLVRISRADPEQRIGSLLVNPGGPGASGVDAGVFLSIPPFVGGLPDSVTERFDIVGFDPRGVSRSSPVDCLTNEELDLMFGADPDPVDQAAFDEAVAASQRRTGACGTTHGDALNHYSTRQTVHDMDAIRAALGDEKLTYLGYSYGTLLGAIYAHLYPTHIRAMVLDGAIDPDPEPGGEGGGQAAGFERAFDNFANWCNATPTECPLGPDTRATVTAAIEAARTSPVPGADGRDATAGWVWWAVVSALYSQQLWPQLGQAIASLQAGDPAGVFTLADLYTGRDETGSYPNLIDANTAINCADAENRGTVEEVRDAQADQRERYPLFGAPLVMGALDCIHWQGEADPYPVGPAEGAPPILVVGTTGDPATPYEQAAGLADLLGTGVVLTYEGEGHTVYPQDECVNEVVNTYLFDVVAETATC